MHDRESIIKILEEALIRIISFLFKWFSNDGEIIGYILSVFHVIIAVAISACIVLSHTLYPITWFQVLTFCITVIIWLQHICLKVCISTVAERNLTKTSAPSDEFLRYIMSCLFESSNDPLNNIVVAETFFIYGLFLELLAKFCSYLYEINGIVIT